MTGGANAFQTAGAAMRVRMGPCAEIERVTPSHAEALGSGKLSCTSRFQVANPPHPEPSLPCQFLDQALRLEPCKVSLDGRTRLPWTECSMFAACAPIWPGRTCCASSSAPDYPQAVAGRMAVSCEL